MPMTQADHPFESLHRRRYCDRCGLLTNQHPLEGHEVLFTEAERSALWHALDIYLSMRFKELTDPTRDNLINAQRKLGSKI